MKIAAVGVSAKDMRQSASFYELLGFQFAEFGDDEQHLEPLTPEGYARLMLDAHEVSRELLGEDPRPGNHSSFAVEYDFPQEVDEVAARVAAACFGGPMSRGMRFGGSDMRLLPTRTGTWWTCMRSSDTSNFLARFVKYR